MSDKAPDTIPIPEAEKIETTSDNAKAAEAQEISNPVQSAAKRIPTNPQLQHFRTADGPFGWFAHGVTGHELNQFVNSIQKHLIESHENNIELRDICEQLMWTLEQFDEKYMQQTLASIKASEKACLEVKTAQERINQLSEQKEEMQSRLLSISNKNTVLQKQVRIFSWIAGCSGLTALIALILHFASLG